MQEKTGAVQLGITRDEDCQISRTTDTDGEPVGVRQSPREKTASLQDLSAQLSKEEKQ